MFRPTNQVASLLTARADTHIGKIDGTDTQIGDLNFQSAQGGHVLVAKINLDGTGTAGRFGNGDGVTATGGCPGTGKVKLAVDGAESPFGADPDHVLAAQVG